MIYIKVEFDEGGKPYIYKSPILVNKGQYVLVCVYGKIVAAKVISRYKKRPAINFEIKTIVGACWMLEDLANQQQQEPEGRSVLGDIASAIFGTRE